MASTFDHADQARAALAAIVADPEFGVAALANPATLSNLLSDYLPDSPRETGPLVAAAQADVAGTLRDHAVHGMDPATAIRITASSLASRPAFSAEACLWVTGELAIALGLTTADRLPLAAPTSQRTDVAGTLARGGGTAGERPVLEGQHAPPPIAGPETQRPAAAPVLGVRRKRAMLAAAAAIVVLAAAAGSAALYLSRRPPGPPASSGKGGTTPKVSISVPQQASVTPVRTSQPSPRQVVEAYIAAVNQHDWRRVWQLGGKNLGASYGQMVAGYRHTSRVVIQSLRTRGQVVTVRVLAYETNGAAQTYRLKYVVSGGIIVAGSSNLLRA